MFSNKMLETSAAYKSMEPYWLKVAAIRGGSDAMRNAGRRYLPQFPNEASKDYQHRLSTARFTDIFSDIVENLASKPFSKEVRIEDGLPSDFEAIQEDIDSAGNHLTVMASNIFLNGILYGLDWIYVEHPIMPKGISVAEAARIRARPYWVRIAARDMLAVREAVVNGKMEIVFAKIRETTIAQDAQGNDTIVSQVRILKRSLVDGKYLPATFEVWTQDASAPSSVGGSSGEFKLTKEGEISIGIIPLVPFITGLKQDSEFSVRPPMSNLADLQIELYQDESNLKHSRALTAFPMYVAKNMAEPIDEEGKPLEVSVGPSKIIYTGELDGSDRDFSILEISATSLKFLSEENDKLETQMREIGRQPLTGATAGLTQIATAFAAQKAASAIQAWAMALKDALERAFVFTAIWLGSDLEPQVYVDTKFAIELGEPKSIDALLALHAAGVISVTTLLSEMQQRGILSSDFDVESEAKKILDEMPDYEAYLVPANTAQKEI